MAKLWWELYDARHPADYMGRELGEPFPDDARAPTLLKRRVLFVRVAGFTFVFHSLAQVQACLSFYEKKLHPSSRSASHANAVANGEVTWRLEVERWFERLPLYLREEPKRQKVVAALTAALREAVDSSFT